MSSIIFSFLNNYLHSENNDLEGLGPHQYQGLHPKMTISILSGLALSLLVGGTVFSRCNDRAKRAQLVEKLQSSQVETRIQVGRFLGLSPYTSKATLAESQRESDRILEKLLCTQSLLEKVQTLDCFRDVLTPKDAGLPVAKQLSKLVASVSTQITVKQYYLIRKRYTEANFDTSHPCCIEFFQDLAEKVDSNREKGMSPAEAFPKCLVKSIQQEWASYELLSSVFGEVLTPQDRLLSPIQQLGKVVDVAFRHDCLTKRQYYRIRHRHAKMNLLDDSYFLISRCPRSKAFVEELAEQIRQNEALLALGDELRTQIPSMPSAARGLNGLINWFNNPNNRAAIQSVRVLNLNNKHLKILPDKLSLFTGIRSLNLSNNHLTSIDVSGLTQLQELRLSHNQLTSLDVTSLVNLNVLSLCDNQLTSLDVTSLVNLRDLRLDNNQIERVPGLSGLGALKYLHLSTNHLTSIDVSGLRSLEIVDLENNQLTRVVGISKLRQLEALLLLNNQLHDIEDLSALGGLTDLSLKGNPLTCEVKNKIREVLPERCDLCI